MITALEPATQTRFGTGNAPRDERGNCVQAALATLFGLPLEAVVNPAVEDDGPTFWAAVDAWAAGLGFAALHFHPDEVKFDLVGQAHCLITGLTPGGHHHTVVGEMRREGELHNFYIVHDPLPTPVGLASVISIILFVRL